MTDLTLAHGEKAGSGIQTCLCLGGLLAFSQDDFGFPFICSRWRPSLTAAALLIGVDGKFIPLLFMALKAANKTFGAVFYFLWILKRVIRRINCCPKLLFEDLYRLLFHCGLMSK
ncbi:hypothetical protein TNCT_454561 [Trichonephila clavata]|uniref:Uncharacterized protein n=1 Tax=Trichonephila clavata TaxID=2740835 RepID=A0A8X6HMV9_TRICU|nr:hypothetical protein TNCT_454561 [Trichonephila clavata]